MKHYTRKDKWICDDEENNGKLFRGRENIRKKEEVKIAVAQRTTTDKTLRLPTLTFRQCSVCAVFIAKT